MSGRFRITNFGKNALVLIVGLPFLWLCIFSLLNTKHLINQSFPGFLVLKNNLVNLIFLPEWEGIRRGVKPRDVILEVNGERVKFSDDLYRIIGKQMPGTMLEYTILRGEKTLNISVPLSKLTLRDYLICYLTWTLVGLVFVIMGLTVFYLRPDKAASWAFLFAGTVVGFVCGSEWEHCTTNVNTLPLFFFPFAGPSMLLVSLCFPEVVRAWKYFIAFILVTTIPLVAAYRYSFMDISLYLKVDSLFLIHLFLNVSVGVFIMIYSFVTSNDPLTRQRGKIISYAFIVGFMGAGFTIIGSVVLKKLNFFWMVPALMLVPLSMSYAIVKHNLFDIAVLIRRSASYIIVSGVALTLFFAVVMFFSLLLQDIIGKFSQVAAVIATILAILVFRPMLKWTEAEIDKRFFREKYEYHRTIRQTSKVLVGIIELDKLVNRILYTIMNAMKIDRGMILLKGKERRDFNIAACMHYLKELQFVDVRNLAQTEDTDFLDSGHPIYGILESDQKPVLLSDLEELDEYEKDRLELLMFMHNLEFVLIVPIILEGRLIGVLGLGAKKSGEWYSSDDIELLQTLMVHTALSIDNAGKVEELKKMVELETSYKELQRINELKDNFIGMVSHDLRTPMTSIKGYASLMRSKPEKIDKETMTQYAEIIDEEANRLTRLINDMLDIQRFEAGRMELELEELDLVVLVNKSVELFNLGAREKKIFMKKCIPEEKIIIRGHGDRLKQVMVNLLSNAVKFTPENGIIKTTVERITDGADSLIKVSIADNGRGIPEDMQSQLFQKFQQVDFSRKSGEGSGLGLALVREIVEYHGGVVGVASSSGEGSTFYFTIKEAL